MFRDLVNRYATPFTTGLFVISAVSGVALFFHVGTGAFRGMHEWLSMVLLLPVALHIWKNWGPVLNYLRRGWLVVPLAVSLVAGIAFAVPSLTGGSGGGNPQMALYRAVAEARIVDVAPILKTTPDALIARLKADGVTATAEQSLSQAATAAGKEARSVVFGVLMAP